MKIIRICFFVILLFSLLFFMGCSTTVPDNYAPVINSNPVTNSLVGVPYTYNAETTDADDDTLIYSLITSPVGMTIDASTGVIDWTPMTTGSFNVDLEVSDGELTDIQSFTITVAIADVLSPPTGVKASDAAYTDASQITWNAVIGATHYQVYRANSLTGTKIAISSWQTETAYYDNSITCGEDYYYLVKASTSSSGENASDFSSPDTGNCTGFVPSLPIYPPTGVEASDILINKVQITWDIVTGASHYRVYRANNLFDTKIAISDWQIGTSYEDNSVTPWTTYYYWVKAATSNSGDNATGFSYPDTGYAISLVPL